MTQSIQDILNKPYARVLLRNVDGGYTAQILEFPGCVAEGDTPDEAMMDLDEAASSWIEVAIEQKESIPEPLANHGYSGKINLRIPKSVHKQAALFAQKDDVSLNQFFTGAIAARIGSEEFYDHLVKKLEERVKQAAIILNAQVISTYNTVTFNVTQVTPMPFGLSHVWPASQMPYPYSLPSSVLVQGEASTVHDSGVTK